MIDSRAPVLHILLFRLDERRFGLPLASVERVIRAVEATPLPGAPATVAGAVNVHGRLLPVFALRQRFGLPAQPIRPDDVFLLAHAGHRDVVLVVDTCDEVVAYPSDRIVPAGDVTPGLDTFSGLIELDGLVLIHDLATFLSRDEGETLDSALQQRPIP